MEKYAIQGREVRLDDSWDVVVAGGGPSGCTAAAAAAREGAKTLLIEATGMLGGMGTAGLVPAWCPFTDGDLQPATHCFTLSNVDEDGFRHGGSFTGQDGALSKMLGSSGYRVYVMLRERKSPAADGGALGTTAHAASGPSARGDTGRGDT